MISACLALRLQYDFRVMLALALELFYLLVQFLE